MKDAGKDVVVLGPDGQPVSSEVEEVKDCPQCGAGPDRRVPSGGFGKRHDVCGRCGFQFQEFTCE